MQDKNIQLSLFDYFQDSENFTLAEANDLILNIKKKKVKIPSIRARIYEGIDSGLFERIGKGIYKIVNKNGCTSLLINGDGKDLSFLENDSIDCIITDHPYSLKKSHKGGNRDLAQYECFQYEPKDFQEKCRVLKEGSFLVEFLPERNADNIEYLNNICKIAKDANLNLYSIVPWKKGNFVINQGRKSKNTEDLYFFTKGKARNLRPDIKKDLAQSDICHYMSGTKKMLPTHFCCQPASISQKIHQAEKPIDLYSELLEYVTIEGEIVLDQFAGSGNLGIATLKTKRNSILIEKDIGIFKKMVLNIQNHQF